MRFSRRLQTIIFGFSLIPTILVIIIYLVTFTLRFDPFVRQAVVYDADLYANKIQSYISEQFVQLHSILENSSMSTIIDSSEHKVESNMLSYHINMHPTIKALYLEDAQRNIVAYYDPLFPVRTSALIDLQPLISENAKRIVSPVITAPAESSEDVYVMMALPINRDNAYLGSMIAIVDLLSLRELAREPSMFAETFRLVFDNQGLIVATNRIDGTYWSLYDFENVSDLEKKFEESNVIENPEGLIYYTFNAVKSLGQYHYIPELGWTVFTGIAMREIYRPMLESIPLFLFFAALFIIVLLFVLKFISNQIGHPIQTLIDGFEHIRDTESFRHIELENGAEFSEIADSFNLLVDQLALESEQLKQLNQELDALTTHIPGGLFKCSLDASLSFLFISNPFISLSGYPSKNALIQASENSFLQSIHPSDRITVHQIIQNAAKNRKEGSFDYRSIGGTEIRWITCNFMVHDEHQNLGAPVLFGMAVDATAIHEAFVQLRASDERYRILLEQTDEVIFEWSIAEKRFLFISREKNWIRMFGSPFPNDGNLMTGNLYQMHPDDRHRFASTLSTMVTERIRGTKIEVRLTKKIGSKEHYIWTRFLLTSLFDNQSKVTRLAGRIQDIHEEKIEALRLIGLSQTDALTGLMNRRGFEASVERILDLAETHLNQHILVMIDVDNFKQTNDTYGHLVGDQVLVSISHHLKHAFRITDLYGRIGGDEFALFLINFQDRERLKEKLELLIATLRRERLFCSIGVAAYPADGSSFTELYKKADKCLYFIKNSGKNGYSLEVESN